MTQNWRSYEMKFHGRLKVEIKPILQQMFRLKNERSNASKEVKLLCRGFRFAAGMLTGALIDRRAEK